MSDRGSPADHAATGTDYRTEDAPASAASDDINQPDGPDAKQTADASSPSEGAKQQDEPKPTLADVIKAAAEKPDPDGSSPPPAKTGSTDTDAPPSDDTTDKKTAVKSDERDDAKLSFHNHPRWQEVKEQNRSYRTEIESLKPDADQFRKINTFMQEHHLSPDEVGDLFIVGAMAKAGDPRCLQKIDEFRQKVALAIGEAIPPDIQAKVDEGEISESAAKELAKARALAASHERQAAERATADQQQAQARELETLRTAQMQSVAEWEAAMRKRDPDFADKENAIARYAKALVQDYGPPPTAKDAVALVEAAYTQVSRDFKAALPPKKAVQRGPIASSSTGAKPQPKTLREAIEQAAAM